MDVAVGCTLCGGVCGPLASNETKHNATMDHPFAYTKRTLDDTEYSYFSLAALNDPRVGAWLLSGRGGCRLRVGSNALSTDAGVERR